MQRGRCRRGMVMQRVVVCRVSRCPNERRHRECSRVVVARQHQGHMHCCPVIAACRRARQQQGYGRVPVMRCAVEAAIALARHCRVGPYAAVCNLAADGPGETSPERAVHPAHVEHLACSECAMAALPARHATTTRAVVVGMRCWCLTLRAPHGGIHAALPALPVCLRLSRSRLPGLFDERHARG